MPRAKQKADDEVQQDEAPAVRAHTPEAGGTAVAGAGQLGDGQPVVLAAGEGSRSPQTQLEDKAVDDAEDKAVDDAE